MEGVTDEYLDLIDALVDGPFIEAQKKITLNFRGSTNQRIIDLKETRKTGTIVLDPLNNCKRLNIWYLAFCSSGSYNGSR